MSYLDPAEMGRWEGDRYVFHEPFVLGNGDVMTWFEVPPELVPPGLTRNDIIDLYVLNGISDPTEG